MEESTADRETSTADTEASRSDVERSGQRKRKSHRRSKKSRKDAVVKADEAKKAGENQEVSLTDKILSSSDKYVSDKNLSSSDKFLSDKDLSSKLESSEKSSGSRRRKKRSRNNSVSGKAPHAATEDAQDRKDGDTESKAPSSTASVPPHAAAEDTQDRKDGDTESKALSSTASVTVVEAPRPPIPSDHATCTTDGCTLYAQKLLASLNTSAGGPCHNFKEFVCGGWKRRNSHSVRQNMTVAALDALAELAHTAHVPLKGQTSAQKGLAFFRSCEAVLKNDRNELATVKRMLAEAKIDWPRRPTHPDVLSTLFYSSIQLRWSPIFNIEIETTGHLRDPGLPDATR
ncbi:hypothetical protein MRX96_023659 [Rhipicephalus microplus]